MDYYSLAPVDPLTNLEPTNPCAVYLVSLSPGSRATQAHAIRAIASFLGGHPRDVAWHRLTAVEVLAVRSWASERHSPATAQRYLSALRGVLRSALRTGAMDDAAYRRAVDVPAIRGANEHAGRALSADELRALFTLTREQMGPVLGTRNAALLAVLYGCGLRRAELVALDLADLQGRQLRIVGKGRKVRTAYVPTSGVPALQAWLALRGDAPGPLFWPSAGGVPGRVARLRRGERLGLASVRFILRGMAKRAGVAKCSPHDLRRTWVGDLLEAGADLVTVQQLAGHANPATTSRYDRRPARARERAADLVQLPI